MVWTDNGNGATPPGFKESITMPYAENGIRHSGLWGIYIDNGNKSASKPTTVWIVLGASINNAAVSVDVNLALSQMQSELHKWYPAQWSATFDTGYWLDGIDIGSEFGPLSNGSGPAQYQFAIYKYNYVIGSTLPGG
jgi:hypothetical protein